jgi:putative SOS response-associated peptidase YedK
MCGRFTLTTGDYRAVAEALEAEIEPQDASAYRPRWNVAPGDRSFIVRLEDDRRRLVPATWGLPGTHAQRPEGHINARSETAHARPAFRDAFVAGRCVIPADGFYEWTGPKDHRLPVWYHAPSGVIALAGLFTEHVDPRTGEVSSRFAILTTAANDLVAPVHDRMPVILDRGAVGEWLRPIDPAHPSIDRLRALLVPAPPDALVATEVSSRANHVAHDDPACVVPSPHPRQTSLF